MKPRKGRLKLQRRNIGGTPTVNAKNHNRQQMNQTRAKDKNRGQGCSEEGLGSGMTQKRVLRVDPH